MRSSAATIRAVLEGIDVVGVHDGFEWLIQGNIEHITPLTIDTVSRIHFRGGSHIGISRANPTSDPEYLENVVISLLRLNVTRLLTIGGDDTAFSAMKVEERAAGRIHVVHVPKTIDNDLDLPPAVDTFGFQTARHYGAEIVKNLMVDAKTTSRWYFVITMGRKAGHLALGIGKAAWSDTHTHSRGISETAAAENDRRHARWRHYQAAQFWAPRRRSDDCGRRRTRCRP
jgi:6-phosphofructokinase